MLDDLCPLRVLASFYLVVLLQRGRLLILLRFLGLRLMGDHVKGLEVSSFLALDWLNSGCKVDLGCEKRSCTNLKSLLVAHAVEIVLANLVQRLVDQVLDAFLSPTVGLSPPAG